MRDGYPVFFHFGRELTIKTKAQKGQISFREDSIHVAGDGFVRTIAASDLRSAEMLRLYGLGSVIKIETDADNLYVAVTRLMVGQFAIINFFATGTVFKRLQRICRP